MAKWVKFTDVDTRNLAYVRYVDLDKVVAFDVYEEKDGARLFLSGGDFVQVNEAYAIQMFERYFNARSLMIEKLEGKQDVL